MADKNMRTLASKLNSAVPGLSRLTENYGLGSPLHQIVGGLSLILESDDIRYIDGSSNGQDNLDGFAFRLVIYTDDSRIHVGFPGGQNIAIEIASRRSLERISIESGRSAVPSQIDVMHDLSIRLQYPEGMVVELPLSDTEAQRIELQAFLPSLLADLVPGNGVTVGTDRNTQR